MNSLRFSKEYPPGTDDGSSTIVIATCMWLVGFSRYRKAASSPVKRSIAAPTAGSAGILPGVANLDTERRAHRPSPARGGVHGPDVGPDGNIGTGVAVVTPFNADQSIDDKALEHAMMEYNRRPNNIDVNETVAWVYYCKGEYAKAVPYINVALRTHSKNPVLLSRAALIYYKSGNQQMAKNTMSETSLQNPYIDPELRSEAETIAKL